MPPPRVSVLMLTYNRPQFIGKAIQSILAQEFQEWELLVVHDGPNEEIPVAMEEWQKRDSRIHYFQRIIPGNIAEASNFGLAHARGEYIAVLDDDDYWAPRTSFRSKRTSWTGAPTTAVAGAASL